MICRWVLACYLMTTLPGVAPVFAEPAPNAFETLFERGAYSEAARLAEDIGDADHLAMAARAVLAGCVSGVSEPDPYDIERAVHYAERSLELDEQNVEARLQLAISLSLQTRSMSTMEVWRSGLGPKGKALANEVLTAEPDNAYAHGFLAVWNIEVSRRAGGLGAALTNASIKDGFQHYETAERLAPSDIGLHWQYARALAALNVRKHDGQIRRAIMSALRADAQSHLERVMQIRSASLLDAMDRDPAAAQRLALSLL